MMSIFPDYLFSDQGTFQTPNQQLYGVFTLKAGRIRKKHTKETKEVSWFQYFIKILIDYFDIV